MDQLVQKIARVAQWVFGHVGSRLGDTVTVHGWWIMLSGKGNEWVAERSQV